MILNNEIKKLDKNKYEGLIAKMIANNISSDHNHTTLVDSKSYECTD